MLIEAPELGLSGIRHAFFTRQGGVSEGIYASLNGGLGSADERTRVVENRRRMADAVGVEPDALVSLHQVHSAQCVVIDRPWPGERPQADAMGCATPGLALAIATADCGPILFADAEARVIGACHAGWRGAFTGVIDATVASMEGLGAVRGRIVAVLGPTIGRDAYEVGPEFVDRFLARDRATSRHFHPISRATSCEDATSGQDVTSREGHAMFDLPGYIMARLAKAGIREAADLGACTYSDPDRFYSYRRTTHRGEPDYGRLISAICLTH